MKKTISIGVVDDHILFRKGLVSLIESLGNNYQVTLQANNGQDFINSLNNSDLPDIVLLDINMPVLDGFETASKLLELYSSAKILVITMNDDEAALIRMLKLGVKGYIGKDVEPDELQLALDELVTKGYYYTDKLTSHLIESLHKPKESEENKLGLTDQELAFIKLACSEDTYIKIADTMCLSPKTIDGYRASVFEKLNIKSRVGLAIYAIKTGLVDLD